MITFDKTKELEDQLGWTKEETKAVLTKLYEKSNEIVETLSKYTPEQLMATDTTKDDFTSELMECAISLATTPIQLFFMGIKAEIAMKAIGDKVVRNVQKKQMKADLAKLGPLGEMLEKMMSGDEKDGTESPSVVPGPAKVD